MTKRIIGLAGAKQSGKSTIAKHLAHEHDFVILSFADPLKTMLGNLGVPPAALWGAEKELPQEILCGRTARHAMQTLGTEWGRDLIHKDLWVTAWKKIAEELKSSVVADDVRFENEVWAIKELGGEVWLILKRDERLGPAKDIHASEHGLPVEAFNEVIVNAYSIGRLHTIANRALGKLDAL